MGQVRAETYIAGAATAAGIGLAAVLLHRRTREAAVSAAKRAGHAVGGIVIDAGQELVHAATPIVGKAAEDAIQAVGKEVSEVADALTPEIGPTAQKAADAFARGLDLVDEAARQGLAFVGEALARRGGKKSQPHPTAHRVTILDETGQQVG
jgi:hypothetical protein